MLPNKQTKLNIFILLIAMALGLSPVVQAEPMGTAFTYQGRLMDKNKPADGLYDFQFRLYDGNDPCTATPLGGPIDENDVDVIDGHFVLELDFGSGIFDGNAVWLETRVVRSPMGSDPATLSPLLELTPTPYAVYAETAGSDNDWMVSGDDMYAIPSGNVGIATTHPSYPLTVIGTVSVAKSYDAADPGLRVSRGFRPPLIGHRRTEIDANTINAYYFSGFTSGAALGLNNKSAGDVLLAQGGGNVGIGTTSPDEKLTVNGTIKSTTSATSGKAVYGEVTADSVENYGVYGKHTTSGNYGYLGRKFYGAYAKHEVSGNYGVLGLAAYGVYGRHGASGNYGWLGSSGHAGYFSGDVEISGTDKGLIFPDGTKQTTAGGGSASVPIGAVIDWWRPNSTFAVPDGYQICDGSMVNDAQSPFDGETLPDLRNKFVLGAPKVSDIGQMGGSQFHNHDISGLTAPHSVVVGVSTSNIAVAAPGLTNVAKSAHTHITLPHDHGAGSLATSTAAHLPPYVGLLKIMRIR